MTDRYASASAFRRAFEDRLRVESEKRGLTINDLRQRLVMERLLARLFADDAPPPWLLKGGYAMDLRFRPNARTTRDLDLSAFPSHGHDVVSTLAGFRELLQEASAIDAGDYLNFRIGTPRQDLPGARFGGTRFPVVATLAGKDYARFHIDAGFADEPFGEPETLLGDSFFDFAGLLPARVIAIPLHQQFAEKVHALTYPWTDRVNTRVKDLVDLVAIVQRGTLDPATLRRAIAATFASRRTHPIPDRLPDPPASWNREFSSIAKQAAIGSVDAEHASAVLQEYWVALDLPG